MAFWNCSNKLLHQKPPHIVANKFLGVKLEIDDELEKFEKTMENVSGVMTNATTFIETNNNVLSKYKKAIDEKNKIIETLHEINKQNIVFIEFLLSELINKEVNYNNFAELKNRAKQHDNTVVEYEKQINNCENVLDEIQTNLDGLIK